MENNPTWLLVVAAALQKGDGRWLMHRRPLHKEHGGLWEFPGGKVETGENPTEALIRELGEELGISARPDDCNACTFAQQSAQTSKRPIVILLYTLTQWVGEPQCLEGGEIGWFTADEIAQLEKPPLDIDLAARLFPPQ